MLYAYTWLIVGIILLIVEVFTADFLFASIGLACLIASIPAFAGLSVAAQAVTFAISSVIIFALVRPFAKKLIQGKNHAAELGLNTLVGKKGIVAEEINNPENRGKVKIDGDLWRAISETGENIETDARVVVKKSESITVYVERENQ